MSSLRWIPFCAMLSLALLSGCGDDGGGCAAPPEKKDDSGGGGAGGGKSSGGGGGGDIIIQEKRSKNVPKPYQRKPGEPETPAPAQGSGAAPAAAAPNAPAGTTAASKPESTTSRGLPVMRVTRRKVDGISNRVEVKCRIMATSSDGECSSAANYEEIKQKCCPGGIVERCQVGMRGVVLIGLDCEKKQQ